MVIINCSNLLSRSRDKLGLHRVPSEEERKDHLGAQQHYQPPQHFLPLQPLVGNLQSLAALYRAFNTLGAPFTDNVERLILKFILQQKVRCRKIILRHDESQFAEIARHDLKYLR